MNPVTVELYRQAVSELAPTLSRRIALGLEIGVSPSNLDAFTMGYSFVPVKLICERLEVFLASLEK
jgi:hypothetical protein